MSAGTSAFRQRRRHADILSTRCAFASHTAEQFQLRINCKNSTNYKNTDLLTFWQWLLPSSEQFLFAVRYHNDKLSVINMMSDDKNVVKFDKFSLLLF